MQTAWSFALSMEHTASYWPYLFINLCFNPPTKFFVLYKCKKKNRELLHVTLLKAISIADSSMLAGRRSTFSWWCRIPSSGLISFSLALKITQPFYLDFNNHFLRNRFKQSIFTGYHFLTPFPGNNKSPSRLDS